MRLKGMKAFTATQAGSYATASVRNSEYDMSSLHAFCATGGFRGRPLGHTVEVYGELYGWIAVESRYVQGAIVVGEILDTVFSPSTKHWYKASAARNTEDPHTPIPDVRLCGYRERLLRCIGRHICLRVGGVSSCALDRRHCWPEYDGIRYHRCGDQYRELPHRFLK
ncbi:hypothetical protein GGR56DRAFT_153665 [Xylariaceae sp. FL0804]|nr:hypothetical protein GGR56DRAFT_153665 [Xylariaceae sp. FL0804]